MHSVQLNSLNSYHFIQGYELSKGRRFAYGKGIYSTPCPEVAEKYAKSFRYCGRTYKVLFMNRVNLEYTRIVQGECGVYYLTSDEAQIRPYAILVKEVNEPAQGFRH